MKESVAQKSLDFKALLKEYTRDPSFPSLVVLLLLIIINVSIQPNFFAYRTVKSNFMTFTPLILISMGQAIIILSGNLDLSVGAAMSLLTCIMASMMTESVPNVIAVLAIGVISAVILSLFNGSIIGFIRLPPLISTFATSAIFFGLALTIMPLPGGFVPRYLYRWYRGDVLGVIPVPIFILLIGFGVWAIVKKTGVYRYIYAVGGNEDGAYSSGIKVANIKVVAFLFASFFIALAGISLLLSTAIGDPRAGQAYTLNSIAAVVIGGISLKGGKGSVVGAIVGALILGLLINIIFFLRVSSLYQNFARGMIIIIALSLATIPKLRETSHKIL